MTFEQRLQTKFLVEFANARVLEQAASALPGLRACLPGGMAARALAVIRDGDTYLVTGGQTRDRSDVRFEILAF